jgi:twitching motility protein PilT
MDIEKILSVAVRGGASDIILKTGAIPRVRFNGDLITLANAPIVDEIIMQQWVDQLVPPHLSTQLGSLIDLDFSYQSATGHRFRVNLFRQKQSYAIVLRLISNHIRSIAELQLPPVIEELTQEKRGLILVTGATGSGKTTTLAAMLEKINVTRPAHIITIEDPVEFIFQEKKATINQREIGLDTPSFEAALRSALRQNPDIILVGELRDKETTETALQAAETGHLVFSTLHTLDAAESISRLLSYFPPHQHETTRAMLGQVLRAVLSQRLIGRADKKGMVAAVEVMLNKELVREQILLTKDFKTLKDAIKKGHETYGMQTFDQALLSLYRHGVITREEAIAQASNPSDVELAIRGVGR